MSGLDNLLYMSSISDDTGQSTTTLTFATGTDPNIAQVPVQNKLQLATPNLPQQVQQSGIRVTKSTNSFLMVIGFVSADNSMNKFDIANYVVSNVQDPISRVNGVGNLSIFGSQYAMRIWLDPSKLNSFALAPLDVTAALQAQNVQISGGQLGGTPAVQNQQLTAAITESTLLRTPEQFGAILLKVMPDGSQVRLRDVARVGLGAESFNVDNRYNGQPASGIGIQLATGANAHRAAAALLSAWSADRLPERCDALHQDLDPGSGQDAAGRDRARIPGDVPLPAEHPRHPHSFDRGAGRAAGNLRRDGGARLHHQHAFDVRPGAGDRPARGRRHRGGGKRRARHARGRALAPRGDPQGDGADHRRAGRRGDGDLRRVHPGGVLERHGGRYLPRILAHHRRGDAAVRVRRADADAGAVRHHSETQHWKA